MLRVTGRVFLGFGPVPGEEARAPTRDEREKADRPLWLMLLPTTLLLALALPGAEPAAAFAARAAAAMMHPDIAAIIGAIGPLPSPGLPDMTITETHAWLPWVSVALALAIAAYQLGRGSLPRNLVRASEAAIQPVTDLLQGLHSGLAGDYVTWLLVGLALFACAFWAV